MLLPEFIEEFPEHLIKVIKKYLFCFLSAIFLILSFSPIDLYFFAWISFVPFFFFLYNAKDYKTVIRGSFIFGFLYFLGNVYWIYHSLYFYGSVPLILSYVVVALLSAYLALYPLGFALFFKNLLRNNIPTSLYAPFIWISFEVLRSYLFTGFPWALIGYSQYKFLLISQIADITGIYGVSFLVLLFNCIIFDILIFKKRKLTHPLLPMYTIVLSTFLVLIVFSFSIFYGLKKLKENESYHNFKVAIIQGNIPQNEKWDFKKIQEILGIYKTLTIESKKYGPELIVWPETALPFIFEKNRYFTEELINFVRQEKIYLLLGSIMEREKGKYTNSALLLDPHGVIAYYYDKIHLVPFGEYVPLRRILFFVEKLTVGLGDYQPGKSYNVAITHFGRFATLICYESIFPEQVRKFYQKGGNFIVNITNDGWFGNTSGPYQHFSMAVFRAIENRKPLIRSANSGISGFIDSKGRIIKNTKLFERTYLIENVGINNKITFYTKYGNIFAYLCIVISLIFIIGNINIGGKRWLYLRI